jgi:hypothetical protein
MYLAEAEAATLVRDNEQSGAERLPSVPWQDFPYSQLTHHGTACCDIGREWIRSMDFAQLNGADLTSGPRWLRAKYKWGPSAWPMHWCEVVTRETIDCGAHAALSREAFAARGLIAFPAQLVQKYSEEATDQWRQKWGNEEVSCHWLDGEHIYHEATALLIGDAELKIWDASSGSWLSPRLAPSGYGSVLALRIFADAEWVHPHGFAWGDRRLGANTWNQIAG